MQPRGKITPHVTAHYKAVAVISPTWVMLINLVSAVMAITDGGWPLMSLISHVGARTWVTFADTEARGCRRETSADQDRGKTRYLHAQTYMHAQIHQPLCCCSPRWESFRNASWETGPARTAVSFPAERKIASIVYFCRIRPFAEHLANFRSNSTYLHKITNFSSSTGSPRASLLAVSG